MADPTGAAPPPAGERPDAAWWQKRCEWYQAEAERQAEIIERYQAAAPPAEGLEAALVELLLPFAGDGGDTEGAVECLRRLLSELREARASVAPPAEGEALEAAKAVEAYAQWCGGVHDDGCPEDDTCRCSGKWINDGVTAAVNLLRSGRGR